jgi:hypothetical protein
VSRLKLEPAIFRIEIASVCPVSQPAPWNVMFLSPKRANEYVQNICLCQTPSRQTFRLINKQSAYIISVKNTRLWIIMYVILQVSKWIMYAAESKVLRRIFRPKEQDDEEMCTARSSIIPPLHLTTSSWWCISGWVRCDMKHKRADNKCTLNIDRKIWRAI